MISQDNRGTSQPSLHMNTATICVATMVVGTIVAVAQNNLKRITLDDGLSTQNPDPILFGRGGEEMKALRRRFDAAYDQRYGHCDPDVPAQIVTLRLAAIGTVAKPKIARLCGSNGQSSHPAEQRKVYFETAGASVDVTVVQRDSLLADQEFEGPLIIEEHASTTVVHPQDRVRVDGSGCLMIEIGGSARP